MANVRSTVLGFSALDTVVVRPCASRAVSRLYDDELRGVGHQASERRVATRRTGFAHNTFDQPEQVKPASFTDAKLSEGGFSAKLPAKSVVVLELE